MRAIKAWNRYHQLNPLNVLQYLRMSRKKDTEPLKLMPLDEFKKFVQAIVRVPKDKIEQMHSKESKPKS